MRYRLRLGARKAEGRASKRLMQDVHHLEGERGAATGLRTFFLQNRMSSEYIHRFDPPLASRTRRNRRTWRRAPPRSCASQYPFPLEINNAVSTSNRQVHGFRGASGDREVTERVSVALPHWAIFLRVSSGGANY